VIAALLRRATGAGAWVLTGAQARWVGCAPEPVQRIYFANHQSHFDWVLIWAALPKDLRATTRPIAARDYWTASRFKHWLTREVFNAAIRERAASVVVVHNHPSGDPTPSKADIEMTREIVAAGEKLGISVHDHVVIGRSGETSFKTAGLL